MSTVFIHMVVEVRESLERATNMGMIPRHMEFPFAELLICMGKSKPISVPVNKPSQKISSLVKLLTEQHRKQGLRPAIAWK